MGIVWNILCPRKNIVRCKNMKGPKKAIELTWEEQARYIDQSVLKPEFSDEEIIKYIQEGVDFKCKTVCINPSSLDIAVKMTEGTETGICVVCDFPFGKSSTVSKVAQGELICKSGKVDELDVVSNCGWIRSKKWLQVRQDIKAVVDMCHSYNVKAKIILETDALSSLEIQRATEIAVEAGADFIKSSTGFYTGGTAIGASNEIMDIMLKASAGRCLIKGSGAIRTREHFLELIDMGVDRMGIGYKSTPIVLGKTIEEVRKL